MNLSSWKRGSSKTIKLPLAAVFLAACLVLAAAGCAHRPRLTVEEYFQNGYYFEKNNRPWDAIVQYRKALSIKPKNTDIRLRLADLLVETGNHGSAQRNYRTILEYDPENIAAINNLSWLYTITGWHLDWAEEAMKPLAARPSPHRHIYLDTLGMVYLKRGKKKEAAEAFDEAASLCRKGVVMSTSDECEKINEHLRKAGIAIE